MRPINKSNRLDINGYPLEFKEYRDAKPDLVKELGDFCCYCGIQVSEMDLHVEHIMAKDKNPTLENRWDNFLLACSMCNSIKSNKGVIDTFMPHKNNLLYFVNILQAGVIEIKENISEDDKRKTQNFIDLVGLDREPSHPKLTPKDKRWRYRLEAYNIAERHLIKYEKTPPQTDIETIIDLAKNSGFFSIWFTVFDKFKEVKQVLINAFPNTDLASFDASDQYEPLRRDL
jgi:uncharacterized protein (TIGR02646 family)